MPAVLQFLRSPGHRPFDAEVALGLIYAAEKDATKVVDTLLVEFWIDVNAKDDRGRTALLAAAEAGALSTLKSLLASDRIDVKAVDSLKRTALMLASLGGHALAVQHLLADPRTNPRSRDSNLHTAFLHAAISGHLPTLEILLADPRVDPEVRNAKGESALDLASEPARTFLRSAVAAKKAALTRALKLAEVKARLPPAPPLVADSKGRRKELVDIDREPPKQARPGSTDRNSKFK